MFRVGDFNYVELRGTKLDGASKVVWSVVRVLRGVVLDLDAERLEEFEVLITDLEFRRNQRWLVAGLLTRLADPDVASSTRKIS